MLPSRDSQTISPVIVLDDPLQAQNRLLEQIVNLEAEVIRLQRRLGRLSDDDAVNIILNCQSNARAIWQFASCNSIDMKVHARKMLEIKVLISDQIDCLNDRHRRRQRVQNALKTLANLIFRMVGIGAPFVFRNSLPIPDSSDPTARIDVSDI